MLRNVIEAERDQAADCARIAAAIRLAEQEFAALDGRHYDPEEARKRWTIIRDRTIFAIRDVRRNIAKRASEASATRALLIEKCFRERADCIHDRTVHDFSAMLQDTPTRGLLDHLSYLVEVGDLSRIQGVRAVFGERDDRHWYAAAFEKILARFAFGKVGDDLERLARIYRLAEESDARLIELFCAHERSDYGGERGHASCAQSVSGWQKQDRSQADTGDV
jgi:hypothetical protein